MNVPKNKRKKIKRNISLKWEKNCNFYAIHPKSKRNFDYKLLKFHL